MREQATLSRRAIAAALPLAALAGATPAAPAALPALYDVGGTSHRIDATAERCRAAKQAMADALYAYECALPPLHFTLDMTHRRPWPFRASIERRPFDGATPKRGIDFLGNPGHRYVATVETIADDIETCPVGTRKRRGMLYRMRRRAKARAAKIEALEASFRLEDIDAELQLAQRDLEELTQELFAEPATNMAAVLVQAKALSAYAETIDAGHARYQAGGYGAQLAAGLQNVARAA